jgi:HEAT repeat protein
VGARDNVLDTLGFMLADQDVRVRIAVISTVNEIKNSRIASLLQKVLKDPVPELDLAAAMTPYRLRERSGKEVSPVCHFRGL